MNKFKGVYLTLRMSEPTMNSQALDDRICRTCVVASRLNYVSHNALDKNADMSKVTVTTHA